MRRMTTICKHQMQYEYQLDGDPDLEPTVPKITSRINASTKSSFADQPRTFFGMHYLPGDIGKAKLGRIIEYGVKPSVSIKTHDNVV